MSDESYKIDSLDDFVPQSRVEALLKMLIEKVANNGGNQGGDPEQPGSSITFQSDSEFSLATTNGAGWDGSMEYSTDNSTWFTWGGESITAVSNSGPYVIYLRGSGNTTVTNNGDNTFTITGTGVKCGGNIESLLDHAAVAAGDHPNMADHCYKSMFSGCTGLTIAPNLGALTLTEGCYDSMFFGCTSLTTAPALPATTLAGECYFGMFYNCTSLTTAPELPATTLEWNCYWNMFYNCTSLTTAPELPATTVVEYCYDAMFYNCTSLTTAPELPATTMAENCYDSMFFGCTSLTAPPALPATTLAAYCYNKMFYGCTSLNKLPALPATTMVQSCYSMMFRGCTSIVLVSEANRDYNIPWRIPMTGSVVATNNKSAYIGGMFDDCSNIPTINFDTEYYTLYTLVV